MIRSKKEKAKRLSAIVERLKEYYPEAECALQYEGDAWKLLVMGRLSAQCTDARVNVVCKELFAKYPDSQAMAEAPVEEIEKIIRPCGLFRTKAESIKAASEIISSVYGGKVPDTMEALVELPGVGRKIANLILGDAFGKEAIVCDTHCIRICGRLGMYPEALKDAVRIERILREIIDLKEGSDFCHRVVTLGREICIARRPECEKCPLGDLCERGIKTLEKTSSEGGK